MVARAKDGARDAAQAMLQDVVSILAVREGTHGNVRDNFDATAKLWSAWLGWEITVEDVAVMMVLVKLGRMSAGDDGCEEHWADAVGYLALGAGLRLTRPCPVGVGEGGGKG